MTQNQPILDYQNTLLAARKPLPLRKIAIRFFSILIVGFLLLLIFAPILGEYANRKKCAQQISAIGCAIQMYVNDYRAFPNSITSLKSETGSGRGGASIFICPSSNDTPVNTLNWDEIDKKPGHCSYIFVCLGQKRDWLKDPARILAYENPKNHDNKGMNVLYADDHVDWADKKQMNYILSELSAGFNPPRKIEKANP